MEMMNGGEDVSTEFGVVPKLEGKAPVEETVVGSGATDTGADVGDELDCNVAAEVKIEEFSGGHEKSMP
jgi:hypothetical protein